MSDPDPFAAAERIGVIDLGSNSLRLVVFERLGAAVFPLLGCGKAMHMGSFLQSSGFRIR